MYSCLAFLILFAVSNLGTTMCLCQEEIIKKLLEETAELKRQVKDLRLDQSQLENQNQKLRFAIEHLAGGNILSEYKSKRLLMTISQSHKRPAFSASLSSQPINLGTQQTIVFNNVFTNDGNVYSPLTGIFTAPHNGTYYFSTTITAIAGEYLLAEITLNGKSLVNIHSKDSSYEQGTNSIVLALTKGDMVWVRNYGNEGRSVHGYNWSTFSGFQISE